MTDFTALYREDATAEEYLATMQALVNSGDAWRLEGSVGRAAMSMIEAGALMLGHEGHRDYWGNYVPGRDEVEPGTKGSRQFVVDHGNEPVDDDEPDPDSYAADGRYVPDFEETPAEIRQRAAEDLAAEFGDDVSEWDV